MARKGQVSIQDSVETNEEFEEYLEAHADQLICMEVYSDFCGNCLATGNAVRRGKLEIGQDKIAMVKAMSDNIDALIRFRDRSEPVFLFIECTERCERRRSLVLTMSSEMLETRVDDIDQSYKGKLTRAMFGANGIELCRIIEEELHLVQAEEETGEERHKWNIHEMLPEEAEKIEQDLKMEEEYKEASERLRVLTLAARKRRVCERLSKHVKRLNFIMFWPHCHQAHYDLYEKWDNININVAAKDSFQLDEKKVREALYMSDVEMNEACIHSLLSGEVMVVLFKMFDTDDRDFVKLLRQALYEDIPVPKEDVPPEKQVPPVPAYERYATISKTAQEVRRDRHNVKLQKLREEQEERDRLAAEQARLAREAEEERLREEKQRAEEERMRRIQAGLPPEPEPEPEPEPPQGEGVEGEVEGEEKADTVTETVTETGADTATDTATEATDRADEDERLAEEQEKVAEEEEFHSDVEVEGEEYIPPGGLFVPGLYAPPNELAKANGLALFYPKQVTALGPIESEFLPPHVLVIFNIDKRHDVQEVVKQYADEILAVGVFVGDDPFAAEHVAYSIKQYDKMERIRRHKDRLALMVSRKRSLPLLQLAGLNPIYISADVSSGERDCLQLFPVGYGDDFEEEPSVVEEEIEEIPPTSTYAPPQAPEHHAEAQSETEARAVETAAQDAEAPPPAADAPA